MQKDSEFFHKRYVSLKGNQFQQYEQLEISKRAFSEETKQKVKIAENPIMNNEENDQMNQLTEQNSKIGQPPPNQGKSIKVLGGILKNAKEKVENIPFYEQQALQRRQQYYAKMKEKKNTYKKFIDSLDQRKNIFTKFSFKSYEKDENPFINPLMKKVNQMDIKGSMYVIDLWGDRTLKRYLSYSKFKDGKYIMKGIAQQINQEQKKLKRDQPTIFTTKDETILKGKLEDKGQLNHFLKHLNDDFNKNENLLDQKINKNGLNDASIRDSASLMNQDLEGYLQGKEDLNDPSKPFDEIKFIKNFFFSTSRKSSTSEIFPNLSSPTNFLSPSPSPASTPSLRAFNLSDNSQNLTNSFSDVQKFISNKNLSNRLKKKSTFYSSYNTEETAASSKHGSIYSSSKQSSMHQINYLGNNEKNKSVRLIKSSSKLLNLTKSEKEGNFYNSVINSKLNTEFKTLKRKEQLLKTEKSINQSSLKINEDISGSDNFTVARSARLSNNFNIKKTSIHSEKLNSMVKEMDNMLLIDINNKKKIEDLVDRFQEKLIVSQQSEKKSDIFYNC